MNLEDLIRNQLSDQDTLGKIGRTVGVEPNQVQQLSKLALPTMVEALSRNASTPEGAQALSRALKQHQDDRVDDIAGYLDSVDREDGAKILQHMFADKNPRVQKNLSAQTGLDSSQVVGVLVQLAPLVLGMLANQSKSGTQKASRGGVLGSLLSAFLGGGKTTRRADAGAGDLGSILVGMLGGSGGSSGLSSLAAKVLDSEGDDEAAGNLGKLLGGR